MTKPIFTKQDAYTFLIGLGAALLMVLGQSFATAESLTADPEKWLIGLGTGLMSAAGRYLVTEIAQRGLSR